MRHLTRVVWSGHVALAEGFEEEVVELLKVRCVAVRRMAVRCLFDARHPCRTNHHPIEPVELPASKLPSNGFYICVAYVLFSDEHQQTPMTHRP